MTPVLIAQSDPLEDLVYREVSAIDPRSQCAHHWLRHCRAALAALERGDRSAARSHLADAVDVSGARRVDIGGRPLTAEETSELARLCARANERRHV